MSQQLLDSEDSDGNGFVRNDKPSRNGFVRNDNAIIFRDNDARAKGIERKIEISDDSFSDDQEIQSCHSFGAGSGKRATKKSTSMSMLPQTARVDFPSRAFQRHTRRLKQQSKDNSLFG